MRMCEIMTSTHPWQSPTIHVTQVALFLANVFYLYLGTKGIETFDCTGTQGDGLRLDASPGISCTCLNVIGFGSVTCNYFFSAFMIWTAIMFSVLALIGIVALFRKFRNAVQKPAIVSLAYKMSANDSRV